MIKTDHKSVIDGNGNWFVKWETINGIFLYHIITLIFKWNQRYFSFIPTWFYVWTEYRNDRNDRHSNYDGSIPSAKNIKQMLFSIPKCRSETAFYVNFVSLFHSNHEWRLKSPPIIHTVCRFLYFTFSLFHTLIIFMFVVSFG